MSDPEKAPDSERLVDLGGRLVPVSPRVLREASLYFGLAAIFSVGCVVSDQFLDVGNQMAVLRQVSQNGILAVGMTLVIITAGIDLSVGRMLGLGSTLAAMLLIKKQWTAAAWLTLPAAAIAGGVLVALLARALLIPRRREALEPMVVAGAFLVGVAVILLWTIPQVGSGLSILTVLIVVPLAGLLLGGVSGVVIAKFRLQPFIVTLAMMTAAYGGARLIASAGGTGYIHSLYDTEGNVPPGVDWLRTVGSTAIGETIVGDPDELPAETLETWNVRSVVHQFPVPGLFFLVCLGAGMFILRRLRFGRYIYAIGGNEETARLSGISVERIKIAVYAISGMLSFLAGVLACAQYRQGKPEMGQMAELDAIAAVVIGGTSLMGGRGRMMGTLVGVLIFGYLTNILSLRGVSTDVQLFVTGLIIIGAVLLQEGFGRRG
jgi:simple sugar transport system permease protein